jgi:hypothetical protein
MLMSLLPGLRQLRAPVSAGVIWLLVLWFSVGEELLASPRRAPLINSVLDLSRLLGRPISLGLLAVSTYVIGVLSGEASDWLNRATGGLAHIFRIPAGLIPARRPDRLGEFLLMTYFMDVFSERLAKEAVLQHLLAAEWVSRREVDGSAGNGSSSGELPRSHPLSSATSIEEVVTIVGSEPLARREIIDYVVDLEWYARQVTEQRWRLVRNVAVAEPEIFNLIDRYFAESDFIRELIFPLSALGLVIAVRFSPAGIILIAPSLALMQIVDRPLVEGYGYLYAAISAGKLDFGELTEWTSGTLRLKQVVK